MIPKSIFDDDFSADHIGWCSDDNISRLFKLMEGTVLVPDRGNLRYIPIARQTKLKLILVDDPRREFSKYLEEYDPVMETEIHPSAIIGQNTVIHPGTKIGENVIIGDNCTIGGCGFGYTGDDLIPHKGNVVISDGVHIGSNTCIDRAVIGSTVIGENTKIDNLVHIAHGCKVGKSCKVIASSVLCGSVELGDHVWVAPKAVIKQKVKVGSGALIGLGAIVLSDVPSNYTVKGVYSKKSNSLT